ncbi:MAG: integrase arm-type DNA-binding domain-containing protein [Proteobacteria bacterium]|nr:integrase arm-type DNA-binding domain-containing protein [Pseudomonadota bacterium]
MAKKLEKLVAKHLWKLPPAMHNDGAGLYLLVRETGSRVWIFRYRDRVTGKLRDKGLGPLDAVTLAQARVEASKLRSALQTGVDPIQSHREAVQAARVKRAKVKTFGDCCATYIKAHRPGWRNAKHAQQWCNTLDTYAADLLPLPVNEVDTDLVLSVLEPIWATKTETATRVRQRIENVLDMAKARGLRRGENPARWRGHLQNLLPEVAKVKKVTPRAALPYEDMPAFWQDLSERDTLASLALRLQILTATRPSEAAGARWEEIDLKAKLWTIPGERMKAGREHRVPLSAALVAMLEAMPHRTGPLFPGGHRNPTITTDAAQNLVKALRPGLTAHGFRSTFRDWTGDQTAYPRDVAEMALAHAIKDKTEAAYRRRDMLERRARLMQDWATYCTQGPAQSGTVTPIRRKATA